ncbi:hypothetical protein ACWD26_02860 [Streptomyces sp. NPDC002787]
MNWPRAPRQMTAQAAALLLLALGATACAGEAADARTSSPQVASPSPGKSLTSNPGTGTGTGTGTEDASSTADAVAEFAGERFPEHFAGVAVDGATTVVHRVPSDDSALDAAVSRRFPGEPVRFADAPRSAKELDALTRRIVGDNERLRSEGVRVSAVGPDMVRGVVVVNTDDPAQARPLLEQRYGDAVTVEGRAPDVTPAG